MGIRPVDFGGMIQRTDDVGVIKHQEDHKAVVDQSNITVTLSKEGEEKLRQVQNPDNTDKLKNDPEGHSGNGGGYQKQNDERKKKKENQSKVVRKTIGGGFDIKI